MHTAFSAILSELLAKDLVAVRFNVERAGSVCMNTCCPSDEYESLSIPAPKSESNETDPVYEPSTLDLIAPAI